METRIRDIRDHRQERKGREARKPRKRVKIEQDKKISSKSKDNESGINLRSQSEIRREISSSSSSTSSLVLICEEITRLPIEILIEICSYLNPRDLYNLREVSKRFESVVGNPAVWRTFEVTGNDVDTIRVIKELKRMPLLRKFTLDARTDIDDILRQLSVTNKNLEELYILNCTGSTAKLHLKSHHLIRILEKCGRLHTINILGTRFRGLKFYRLLADMGLRLRAASAPATTLQFRTFANNAIHIPETARRIITELSFGAKYWANLHYYVIDRGGGNPSAFISYLNRDFISVDF